MPRYRPETTGFNSFDQITKTLQVDGSTSKGVNNNNLNSKTDQTQQSSFSKNSYPQNQARTAAAVAQSSSLSSHQKHVNGGLKNKGQLPVNVKRNQKNKKSNVLNSSNYTTCINPTFRQSSADVDYN